MATASPVHIKPYEVIRGRLYEFCRRDLLEIRAAVLSGHEHPNVGDYSLVQRS